MHIMKMKPGARYVYYNLTEFLTIVMINRQRLRDDPIRNLTHSLGPYR